MKTFEEYLSEQFFKETNITTKERYQDDFEFWISELDPQEIIDFAEKWHKEELITK